jgi:hypothetical protein
MYFECKEDSTVKYIDQVSSKEELQIQFNFPTTMTLLIKKNEINRVLEYLPYLACFSILFYFFIFKLIDFFKEIKILS